MMRYFAIVVAVLVTIAGSSRVAHAHCDTTKGPVISAARAALAAGNANFVLHWVRPEDEPAIRSAFENAMEVRALSPQAKALADRYFFETLVRIHRAGEGAPYTGLTDRESEPIIATTDRALERGSAEELEQQLVAAIAAGLAERFNAARAAKDFEPGDVAAGRRFVGAYVPLTHWAEAVFAAASGTGGHTEGARIHDATMHPAAHEAGSHDEPSASAGTHSDDGFQHLPWILAGLLTVAVAVQAAFLVRYRRRVAT